MIDNANHKVIVKGRNVDPMKVLGRLQKKYSRNVELISPKPKPNDKKKPQKKEEVCDYEDFVFLKFICLICCSFIYLFLFLNKLCTFLLVSM